jgi:hypothetical protein
MVVDDSTEKRIWKVSSSELNLELKLLIFASCLGHISGLH